MLSAAYVCIIICFEFSVHILYPFARYLLTSYVECPKEGSLVIAIPQLGHFPFVSFPLIAYNNL